MRGGDANTAALFSYLSCEARVAADHPLRAIRVIVDAALGGLSTAFETLYSPIGRPPACAGAGLIAPEKLLRVLLLQAFYSVRSERQLMEQMDYNLLFRWFVGLGMDAPIWDVTVFTKNRERLLAGDVAAKFLVEVLNQPRVKALLSDDHFSVDGTLIEAWAGIKSFKPRSGGEDDRADAAANDAASKGRNAERDFHAEKLSNDTHASTTDPDARLFRKGRGKEAKLCHMGHLLMENRHGLIVDATLTAASGTAERDAAITMLGRLDGRHRITLGADKAYDVAEFIDRLRAIRVTPHVAQNIANRRSAIDGRTTRHPGYAVSQQIRKRIEAAVSSRCSVDRRPRDAFGWIKTSGGLRKTRRRGKARVGWTFALTAAACNLIRLPKLLAAE